MLIQPATSLCQLLQKKQKKYRDRKILWKLATDEWQEGGKEREWNRKNKKESINYIKIYQEKRKEKKNGKKRMAAATQQQQHQ